MQKAIFLDSDGVLNKAILIDGLPKAPTQLSELEIFAEVKPCLDQLKKAGFLLICVTNKPDIERGLMSQADLDAILNKMSSELPLDDIFVCYAEKADCYKPKPGMLIAASRKYDIDLAQSYMIGDRWRDIGAGQNAGCKTIWINRHYPEKAPSPKADLEVSSLTEATHFILES